MADQPNPIAALVDFLIADADVLDAVGAGNVFGAELPRNENPNMPIKCLVIQGAGGPPNTAYVKIETIRIDVKSYGETPLEAWVPFLAAKNALKAMSHSVQGTALLHDATPVSGPIQLRDGDQDWPLVMGSFLVTVAELATA